MDGAYVFFFARPLTLRVVGWYDCSWEGYKWLYVELKSEQILEVVVSLRGYVEEGSHEVIVMGDTKSLKEGFKKIELRNS